MAHSLAHFEWSVTAFGQVTFKCSDYIVRTSMVILSNGQLSDIDLLA